MGDVSDRVNALIARSASSFEEEGRTAAFQAARMIREHDLVLVPRGQASGSGELASLRKTLREQDNKIRLLRAELSQVADDRREAQLLAREQVYVINSLRDELAEIAEASRIAKRQAAEIENLRRALAEARRQMAELNVSSAMTLGGVEPPPVATTTPKTTPESTAALYVPKQEIPVYDIPVPWTPPAPKVLSIPLEWTPPVPVVGKVETTPKVIAVPTTPPAKTKKAKPKVVVNSATPPPQAPIQPTQTVAPVAAATTPNTSAKNLADLAAKLLFEG